MLIVLEVGSAARTRLGDPAFGDNHELMAEIPTKKFGDEVSARITDVRMKPSTLCGSDVLTYFCRILLTRQNTIIPYMMFRLTMARCADPRSISKCKLTYFSDSHLRCGC